MLTIALILIFIHCCSASITINYNLSSCSTSNWSSNSYSSNVNNLLSALASNITTTKNGFYNLTYGSGSPDLVYGLALCRGDVDVNECQLCLQQASKGVLQACPKADKAILWKEECMLRYSNDSIFSQLQVSPLVIYRNMNPADASKLALWNKELGDLMSNITSKAAKDESGKKFATKEIKFSSSQTLYSLAQCTPDLTVGDCDKCFRNATSSLPVQFRGGIVVTPSCNVRYEVYPFYQDLNLAPSPSLLAPPDIGTRAKGKKSMAAWKVAVAILVPLLAVMGFLTAVGFSLYSRKTKKYSMTGGNDLDEFKADEALIFDLGTLQAATNNFSNDHKLGEGGFGGVYKGTLSNGQEIAVKRLSRSSGQGAVEFKNEVVLVARLQHRNLVRLLGFCIAGEEKLLVYEHVPNKSLNYFLSDPEKQGQLNWSMRFSIIKGIARGLLYLHEDSRLKIIHRDLKAGNILLDANMNPKISDFGLARLLGIQEAQETTNRVVGTYGYMAPEYMMHGQFSVKSDVYSYGVLVLEIITGKKISRFQGGGNSEFHEHLLSHAWRCWKDGKALELMDPTLGDTYASEEVLRSIHLALSCVQENTNMRPTMATVVHTLNSSSVTTSELSTPHRPAFFYANNAENQSSTTTGSTNNSMQWSSNEASISEPFPR